MNREVRSVKGLLVPCALGVGIGFFTAIVTLNFGGQQGSRNDGYRHPLAVDDGDAGFVQRLSNGLFAR
jgi:hypothetical protein